MTAVRPGDIEGLLRRGPEPRILVVLVYGPDTGLVAERAAKLVKGMGADPDDPFAMVKLDGDTLASDPGRIFRSPGATGFRSGTPGGQ